MYGHELLGRSARLAPLRRLTSASFAATGPTPLRVFSRGALPRNPSSETTCEAVASLARLLRHNRHRPLMCFRTDWRPPFWPRTRPRECFAPSVDAINGLGSSGVSPPRTHASVHRRLAGVTAEFAGGGPFGNFRVGATTCARRCHLGVRFSARWPCGRDGLGHESSFLGPRSWSW